MKKGTILIGQQQGSAVDRAYVSLSGFIDPDTGKLVRLSGDALGSDGAPGLKGKRKQVSKRWTRVLSRAASGAVTLGQAALSKGGTTVVVPNAIAPEIQPFSPSVLTTQEFVEISAGVSAFILVTELPKENTRLAPAGHLPATDSPGQALSDEELAYLLTDGSPAELRAALPRMTPELKKLTEAVLKESSDVAEGQKETKR